MPTGNGRITINCEGINRLFFMSSGSVSGLTLQIVNWTLQKQNLKAEKSCVDQSIHQNKQLCCNFERHKVQAFCLVMRIMAEFIHPHLFLHSKCDLNNYGGCYYLSENTTFRNSEELLQYFELRLLSCSKYHYTASGLFFSGDLLFVYQTQNIGQDSLKEG